MFETGVTVAPPVPAPGTTGGRLPAALADGVRPHTVFTAAAQSGTATNQKE